MSSWPVHVFINSCANCHKLPPPSTPHLRCPSCNCASYCSPSCQSADWRGRRHSSICNKYITLLHPPATDGKLVQGVHVLPTSHDGYLILGETLLRLPDSAFRYGSSTTNTNNEGRPYVVCSPLAAKLEVRLCMLPTRRASNALDPYSLFENAAVKRLLTQMDPDVKQFACSFATEAYKYGPALIFRGDGKDLGELQVIALLEWASVSEAGKALEAVARETKAGWRPPRAQGVADAVTPEAFTTFFSKFKAEMARKDPSWENAACPVVEPSI